MLLRHKHEIIENTCISCELEFHDKEVKWKVIQWSTEKREFSVSFRLNASLTEIESCSFLLWFTTVIWCFLWSVFIGDHNQIIFHSFDIQHTKKNWGRNKKWIFLDHFCSPNFFSFEWIGTLISSYVGYLTAGVSTIENPLGRWRLAVPFFTIISSLFLPQKFFSRSSKFWLISST